MNTHLSPVPQDVTTKAHTEDDDMNDLVDTLFLFLQQGHGDLVKAPTTNIVDITSVNNKQNKAA